ncbi:MAG: T9SS type A sorting domain-containing protein, partial [Bacteroidetes bacterium]|nr:T9SS type A sorting domain-containing protein [Bacteroidota bacterium]
VDFLQFRCAGLDVSNLILEDIHGKVCLKSSTWIPKDNWHKLDITTLSTGTYFLTLRGAQYTRTLKFVKAGF